LKILEPYSASLKALQNFRTLFRKIHYYGRKFKNWRARKARQWRLRSIDEEALKEMLRIIALIRHQNPHKGAVTSNDILKFLQEVKI
jgi:hypothetical protein